MRPQSRRTAFFTLRTAFFTCRAAFFTCRTAFFTCRTAFFTHQAAFFTCRTVFFSQQPAFFTCRTAFFTQQPAFFALCPADNWHRSDNGTQRPVGATKNKEPRSKMASNNFNRLGDSALATKLKAISDNVNAAFASYGLTALQSAAWEADADDFIAKIAAVEDARIAYEAAVVAKDVSRAELLLNTTAMTGIIYNFPAITPELLANAGLAVHATTKTPKVPSTPGTPEAQPFATGDVVLSWDPLLNPYGVTYNIEAKGASGNWAIVATTTKRTYRLTGYTPGVETWFRVFATHRGLTATPSLPVVIYAAEGVAELSLAA
jgi:hypothetical protein